MKKRLAIVVAVVSALAFAATGGAIVTRVLTVNTGDFVTVKGTKVVCTVINRDVVNKKPTPKYVTCYSRVGNGGPRAGSYGVAIHDKSVFVAKYTTQTKFKIVFRAKH